MEEFKIEHFAKENEGASFPHYESLSSKESEDIRLRLCHAFDLPPSTFGATLTSKIAALQVNHDGVNAEDEDFELTALANSIGIQSQNVVFVNWYQFDKIDKLAFEDLSTHLNDIWYPASDDIDIFDSSFSWILSVTHDGSVQFVKSK